LTLFTGQIKQSNLVKRKTSLLKKGSKPHIGGANASKTGFFYSAFPEITPFLAKSGTLSLSTRQKPGFFSGVVKRDV
jgi:hypothetical protein